VQDNINNYILILICLGNCIYSCY